MIAYQYDDGGRREAGRKGLVGDCVVRAIAIATGTAYDAVYKEVARLNMECGLGTRSARNGVPERVTRAACIAFGLVKITLPPGPRPTYTEAHERYGDCVVGITGHLCAIVDGALRDVFDGRKRGRRECKALCVWLPRSVFFPNDPRKAMSVWVPRGACPR